MIIYKIKQSIIAVLMMLFYVYTYAQDPSTVCVCSAIKHYAPIGVMIDHAHDKGEWMLSYRYMDVMMQGNLMGTTRVNDERIFSTYMMAPQKMQMQMHMLMAMYGVSDRFTLMGMVNYLKNSMDMSMVMYGSMIMNGSSHSGNMTNSQSQERINSNGFGDIKIYGLYSLYKKEKNQLTINLGASLPTGSISHKGTTMMFQDYKYSYSMQTGTGSVSVLPGITYTGNSEVLNWGAQCVSDFKINKNSAGYKWGNEYVITSWISKNWNDYLSNSLRITGSSMGKIQGFDSEIAGNRLIEPDADINNSGGQRVSAFAGMSLIFPQGTLAGNRIGFEYGLPIYQYLNGIQMRTKAAINIGWQYSF